MPRICTEHLLKLRITNIKEHIKFNYQGYWHSRWTDGTVVRIELTPGEYIDLKGTQNVSLNERVNLLTTPCNYGGERYWFQCPRCSKRVGVLYLNNQFSCRTCQSLTYLVCNESNYAKIRRREAKLSDRLQFEYSVPVRPKGMHHKTFDRLTDLLSHWSNQRSNLFYRDGLHLLSKRGFGFSLK